MDNFNIENPLHKSVDDVLSSDSFSEGDDTDADKDYIPETSIKKYTKNLIEVKTENNNNNKRKASTSIADVPLKKVKAPKLIVHISYITGKLIDPNLEKCEPLQIYYNISYSGRFSHEKKNNVHTNNHSKQQLKISFDNVSFKIKKPAIINEIRASIQASMKKHLKSKDYKIIFYKETSTSTNLESCRDDFVEESKNINTITSFEEKNYRTIKTSEKKNLDSKLLILKYPKV